MMDAYSGPKVQVAIDVRELANMRDEIADLRDTIRLIIGRTYSIPWREVSEPDVNGWLSEMRRLKKLQS